MLNLFTAIFLCFTQPAFAFHTSEKPKLILVVVVDQFRADVLSRFQSRFLPAKGKNDQVGGFQYLMKLGAFYPQGHYGNLQNMTCTGHATILTGAYPYQSGIPTNHWYDRETKQKVYCVEDNSHQWIESESRRPSPGTSPRNLLTVTVGDELKNSGYSSKVVTVALKDRSAILLGGKRADAAIWFNDETFHWVSSDYYFPDKKLPAWVKTLNQEIDKKKGQKIVWNKREPGTGLTDQFITPARPDKHRTDIKPTFPHESTIGDPSSLAMPYGLELTETAAIKALDEMKMGKRGVTDLLAVSFSTPDFIGHSFGPNNRETEEIIVETDRVLSHLFSQVQKRVPGGLKNVLIVLTGDHGVAPVPLWAKQKNMDAGSLNEEQIKKMVSEKLSDEFGKPKSGDWIGLAAGFQIYFNPDVILDKKLDLAQVEKVAKEVILKVKGVAQVVTQAEIAERKLPPGIIEKQTLHSYFPSRTGDLVIIPRIYFTPGFGDYADHVTGYNYDRMVPILLGGFHIRPGTYPQSADVIDIAPTLSFLSGTLPPPQSEGRVLSEALTP